MQNHNAIRCVAIKRQISSDEPPFLDCFVYFPEHTSFAALAEAENFLGTIGNCDLVTGIEHRGQNSVIRWMMPEAQCQPA